MLFRTLRADEIELRVGNVSQYGATLLLYKDARCDMNILDSTVGEFGWKREHSRYNANCTVSIFWKDMDMWVSKEDTGTESNTEKEKGLASSSFKRACTNWGIGRELYSSPHIFINCETTKRNDGRGYELVNRYQFNEYFVKKIEYDDNRNITTLTICDKNGNVAWTNEKKENKAKNIAKTEEEILKELHEVAKEEAEEVKPQNTYMDMSPKDAVKKKLAEMDEESRTELLRPVTKANIDALTEYANELKVPLVRIAGGYGKGDLQHMTKAEYADAVFRLMELKEKRENKTVVVVKEG